jgi:hypothetical protein
VACMLDHFRSITLVHPPCLQGLNIDRLSGLVKRGWLRCTGAVVSCLIVDDNVHYMA